MQGHALALLLLAAFGAHPVVDAKAAFFAAPDSSTPPTERPPPLSPTPSDTSATATPAPAAPTPTPSAAARPDSTAAAAGAPADSSSVPAAAVPDTTLTPILRPRPPRWVQDAGLPRGALHELQPRTLLEALEALPHASVRVAGDHGAPAFVQLSPIDLPAPEILVDGVPTRSPADLDPGVWDRSAAGMAALDGWAWAADPVAGDGGLRVESDPGIAGVSVVRTHFTKQPRETYLRGLSATTPYSVRTLRLDYEEWKTEEGTPFLLGEQPVILGDPLGKSKMRRFRAGGEVETSFGRASMVFGRGRRFYSGTPTSGRSVERWTGEFALGLDTMRGPGRWSVRAWHLDFNTHDFAHAQTQDASRMGVRISRTPLKDGVSLLLTAERQAARFADLVSDRVVLTPAAFDARATLGWQGSVVGRLHATLGAEGAYAERASDRFGVAGQGEARLELGRQWAATAGVMRRLRTPTLLETDGFSSFDLAGARPFTLLREGAKERLPFERLDVARAGVGHEGQALHVEVAFERHWLRDGIGWEPVVASAVDGEAQTVGGLALRVDQVAATARLERSTARAGWLLQVSGHRVLGQLRHTLDRGAGWPREQIELKLRAWHGTFGRHDRLGLEYALRRLGPRFDDLLAPFDVVAPAVTRQDLRVVLRLRDADLYLGVDNLTDALQQEVVGTTGRGRELVWGMVWPFFN